MNYLRFIRKYPVLAALVIARNVSNIPELESVIDTLAQDITNPEVTKWLKSNLRNYLIRDYEKVAPVKKVEDTAPDWLKKAVEENKEVFEVKLDRTFLDKIKHALDYLKSPEAPAKLDRVTVPEAIKQSQDWVKKLIKKKTDDTIAKEGEKIIKVYPDGFSWRELTTKEALDREGSAMRHCVGSYWNQVQSGTQIWSLRDPNNGPHCTLELKNQEVRQIKGKNNGPVVDKYHSYVKDILTTDLSDWEVDEDDLHNIKLVKIDGKTFSYEDLIKDPEAIIKKFFRGHIPERGISRDADGIIAHLFLDELTKFLEDTIGKSKIPEGIEFLNDFDLDVPIRLGDESYAIEDLLNKLEDKYPKTFENLITKIEEYSEQEDLEISDIANDPDLFPDEFTDCLVSSLSDGYTVGTYPLAAKYVANQLSWSNGAFVKYKDGIFNLHIPWEVLIEDATGGSYFELNKGRDRDGFNYSYDDDAGFERFVDMLHEYNYWVD